MKNKKKLLSILLCTALTASLLSGCGNKPAESSKPESSAPVSSVEESSVEESSAEVSVEESSTAEVSKEGSTVEETSKEENSSPEPFVFDYSKGLNEKGFFEGVNASEVVTLPDFTKIEIPYEIHTASDQELAAEVVKTLNSFATTEKIMDREVKNLDNVNIDYVGSVDGVEFAGGNTKGTGTTVQIGVTSYIDDFLEQLIGHKPGETINVEVTFPDSYPQSVELQGKDAVFVTTINYIEETVVPELTDAFVVENLKEAYGWTTAQDLKDFLTKSIVDGKMDSFVTEYLANNCQIASVPEVTKIYQEDAMMNYYNEYAVQYGMPLDAFLERIMRTTKEQLIEENAATLVRLSNQDLIIQAIAETAGIEIKEEELKAFFLENMHTEDYSTFEEAWGLPYLKKSILSYSVTDYVVSQAKLLEKE